METFSLPTREETSISIKIGDAQAIIDVYDYETLMLSVIKDLNSGGDWEGVDYLDAMANKMETEFGLKFSRTTMALFCDKADALREDLKKKLPNLQDSLDSTESPSPKSSKKSKSPKRYVSSKGSSKTSKPKS